MNNCEVKLEHGKGRVEVNFRGHNSDLTFYVEKGSEVLGIEVTAMGAQCVQVVVSQLMDESGIAALEALLFWMRGELKRHVVRKAKG